MRTLISIFLLALSLQADVTVVVGQKPVVAGGGGGAGPFTLIASAVGSNAANPASTASTSTALNLQAGDLVVVWTEWQDGATGDTVTVDENDGTDTFTATAVTVNSSDVGGTFNYLLSAPADASFTVRTTVSNPGRRMDVLVFQFRPTTAPATLDASTTPTTGTGTAVASAALTTSAADTVVIGGSSHASGVPSSEQIGGVNATGQIDGPGGWGGAWYRILTATMTAGTATGTVGASDLWTAGIIAFK